MAIIIPTSSFALTDSAKMILLMKLMQDRQKREQAVQVTEREKVLSKDTVIKGSIVFTQGDENGGVPVAIFETKEFGRLGYLPKDTEDSQRFSEAKDVSIRVKDCVIQTVETRK